MKNMNYNYYIYCRTPYRQQSDHKKMEYFTDKWIEAQNNLSRLEPLTLSQAKQKFSKMFKIEDRKVEDRKESKVANWQ